MDVDPRRRNRHRDLLDAGATLARRVTYDHVIVWSSIEASCPMCRHRTRLRELGGGFALGQDSDLFIRMQGKHVIQAEIHTCSQCRYSGFATDFIDRPISEPMIERYFREFTDQLDMGPETPPRRNSRNAQNTPLPHRQYFWSAQLAPLLGLTPKEIGLRMLRAYWCLRLPPSSSLLTKDLNGLRKLYLRQSIAYLRKALRHEKDSALVYLVAELCRRNGSFIRSENYFDRFLTLAHSARQDSALAYLRRVSRRLREHARRQDAAEKTMEEVLYSESEESGPGNEKSHDRESGESGGV